ncbi:MAG: prolipoprotein diacylglyceryl transferase, partial [Clostridia bacterium]|nr:prolipoprotein diacylglyceryl transferase [Clostridia bacterium]
MIHSFELFGITLYPFWLCALTGAAVFCVCAWRMAKKAGETRYIMPKLLFAFYVGLLGALLYDALFKYIEKGTPTFGGISFYGGLISGAAALFTALRRDRRSAFTPEEWLDKLTVPFMAFHFCGRIGCFLGGCCYGRPTDSIFGVYFPDIPEENIFHSGEKCLPTQLFEAAAILVCAALIATLLKKHRFINY